MSHEKIFTLAPKLCSSAVNTAAIPNATYAGISAPLFRWFRMISLSIGMASPALKAREVFGTLKASKEEFSKITSKIMTQAPKLCSSAASFWHDAGVAYSTVSKPLSKWLEAISSLLKMTSLALEKHSACGILRTSEGKITIAPVFKTVKAFIGVTSGCILGIDLIKIFEKLQSVVPVVDRLINRQNPFKTEEGESVLYPVCEALLALAELVPVCIIGTNCVDFLKELKFISSITDAACNFSKVLGTGDTKEKLISLLQCANACVQLVGKLSLGVASLWLANPAILAVSGLSMCHGVAILVISKVSAAFFKFDEKYNFALSAAEEIFSAAELPNRIVDPIFEPFVTSMS